MTRQFAPFFMLLLLSFYTNAQQSSITQTSEVYKSVDTFNLKIDIFIPATGKEKRNAIVFFHGGGWVFGHTGEFHGACKRYAELGFVTFSVEYRLSVNEDGSYPHPNVTPYECVKDTRSAMRWVRKNAERFNIDPNRIAVGGQSVGGQLTLMTALADSVNEVTDDLSISPAPNLMLLYSSTVNTTEAWCDRIFGERDPRIWEISPYHNARPGMPPAIEFHGLDDNIVKFWTVRLFETRTKSMGNIFEIETYEGRGHYLGEGNEKYSRLFDEEIMEKTDAFLAKYGFMK
ncbi:MAG: alpha/beta hydrolase fold domain-containing protein [Cyclobacteriaceae bacterium]|nr:alpha/beta hydrolase fold domain-containing protein [Cyclobacteriaceae bacterium SS2]